MAPIVAALAGEGLKLLAKVIEKKGKEVVKEKFGVDVPDSPEELDPQTLVKLKEIEVKHREELQHLLLEEKRTYLQDTQDARATYREVSKSSDAPYINKIFPSILAGITVLLTFALFTLFAFNKVDGAQKDIVIYILGVLSTITTQIFAFYFGSSAGSKEKTEILKKLNTGR
ncbi:hypothetical protein GFV12_03200 [Desulfurobacterium thermolithotrophum]|uniref:hypothetical protein n=1 Tax=Desulfurobacterium thermolithotrophum TaxID=64160 RepID=UPI0013D4E0A7|nr:hypothetical protein [Desulfurobacterium thermolithotrophum]